MIHYEGSALCLMDTVDGDCDGDSAATAARYTGDLYNFEYSIRCSSRMVMFNHSLSTHCIVIYTASG